MLRTCEAAAGPGGLEAFVARIEALAALDIASNQQVTAAIAPIMTDEIANTAAQVCGQNDRTNAMLAETRMIEIISDPANLALLNQ